MRWWGGNVFRSLQRAAGFFHGRGKDWSEEGRKDNLIVVELGHEKQVKWIENNNNLSKLKAKHYIKYTNRIRNAIFVFTFITFWHIIIATEPDTPLNDAYHVGSFNLLGLLIYVERATVRITAEYIMQSYQKLRYCTNNIQMPELGIYGYMEFWSAFFILSLMIFIGMISYIKLSCLLKNIQL